MLFDSYLNFVARMYVELILILKQMLKNKDNNFNIDKNNKYFLLRISQLFKKRFDK